MKEVTWKGAVISVAVSLLCGYAYNQGNKLGDKWSLVKEK